MSAIPMSPTRIRPSISPSPVIGDNVSPPIESAVKTEEEETKFSVRASEKRDDDDGMDTRSLLEKMKETIEGMKRRRSMTPRPSLGLVRSPRKPNAPTEHSGFSLLAPGVKEELESALQLEWEASERQAQTIAEDVEESGNSAKEKRISPDNARGPDDDDRDASLRTPRLPSLPLLPTATVNTPRMDDLRHVFGSSRVVATPSFKGMKQLFARRDAQVPDTPVFEGIGEMLRTPEVYHQTGATPAELDSQVDAGQQEVNVDPVIAKRRSGRTRSAALNTPSTIEAEPAIQVPSKARRGRMKAVGDEEADSAKPKGRVLRGAKKATEEQKQVWMLNRKNYS